MIRLENLSKYYYSSSMVTCALRKINLQLEIGEFVAITGESGSGKTTLLNIISGLDKYEDGEMFFKDKMTSYFDDQDWELYRKEEVAFIFQNYNLIDSFSVLENVVSAYIIDGYSRKEAKLKAKEQLKLVGLEHDAHKRASKLSGGQKQRLAIARALAKETNIIVADEPTANLDVENGTIVLELLKKISKNKLVIIVSHNQAQIEPYITRRIRLHDGEIISDDKIRDIDYNIEQHEYRKNNTKVFNQVFSFSSLNIKAQPRKSLLMLLLVLVSTIASFIFIANFKANLDDNKTKEVSDYLFTNFDDTRLLAAKNDFSVLSDEDILSAKVDNVKSVEKYDYITDMNYFRPSDYKIKYSGGYQDPGSNNGGQSSFVDNSSYILLDYSHYMRSSFDLKENDLSFGRLPTGDFEMVVYSDDPSIIGTKELVFFQNTRLWGVDYYYKYEVEIVGILKEKTEQVYFSELICQIMDLSEYSFTFDFLYYTVGDRYRGSIMSYTKIVVDPNIEEYDISFDKEGLSGLQHNTYFPQDNLTLVVGNTQKKYTPQIKLTKEHSIVKNALGVSKELFYEVYNNFKDKTQFAVFIDDYAYTDDVSNDLAKNGYDSLSCFNSSVTGYNRNKVIMRYVNLLVSILALVILNVLIIVIGFAIMKVKKNDYIIFKMIGMTNSLSKKINYVEVIFYGLASTIILVVLSLIIKNTVNIDVVMNMYKYVKFYDYIIVGVVTMISMIILGHKFNKYLMKCSKVTVLKEE